MISWYIDSSCITSPPNTGTQRHHPGGMTPMFHRGRYDNADVLPVCPGRRGALSGSLVPCPEEALSVADSVRQGLHLVMGVVHVEGGPGAGLHAQGPVQRPGTVVAGAHRDAQLVEHLPHVVRVDAFDLERDGAAAILGGVRPEDAHASQLAQGVERVRGQRLLVRRHVAHAEGAEVIHGRGQARGLGHGGNPSPEPLPPPSGTASPPPPPPDHPPPRTAPPPSPPRPAAGHTTATPPRTHPRSPPP